MDKILNRYAKKASILLCFIVSILFIFLILNLSSAFGAGETYSLSVRCVEGATPNTYSIYKVADEDGNFDNTYFNWPQYRIDHPETELFTEPQIMRGIRERLLDNDTSEVGYMARLVSPSPAAPTITSDWEDPVWVPIESGGSYILISDTACPLFVGFDDLTEPKIQLAEKTEGPSVGLRILDSKGEPIKNPVLPQDRILEVKGNIDLPLTYEQFTNYPVIYEINYNPEDVSVEDSPSITLYDGTDVTDKIDIKIEAGKIIIDFGDLKDYPDLDFGKGFDIDCKLIVSDNAKPGKDGPTISASVSYPASSTNPDSIVSTNPVVSRVYLMKLGVLVCNRDTGEPIPGISFIISNDKDEYFAIGNPTWVSRDNASVFTSDANGYVDVNKAVGAGAYILHQLNDADDGSHAQSNETTIVLKAEYIDDEFELDAHAQGAGKIFDLSCETGLVKVKVELGDGRADLWEVITQTLDTNLFMIIALCVLLICSTLIFIQRKNVMKKRG